MHHNSYAKSIQSTTSIVSTWISLLTLEFIQVRNAKKLARGIYLPRTMKQNLCPSVTRTQP